MNTKITTTDTGTVVLAYDDEDGSRIEREFMVREEGGYVREHNPRTYEWKQICERLSSRGPTLMASSRAALADVIRREYKAMRRAEKSEV